MARGRAVCLGHGCACKSCGEVPPWRDSVANFSQRKMEDVGPVPSSQGGNQGAVHRAGGGNAPSKTVPMGESVGSRPKILWDRSTLGGVSGRGGSGLFARGFGPGWCASHVPVVGQCRLRGRSAGEGRRVPGPVENMGGAEGGGGWGECQRPALARLRPRWRWVIRFPALATARSREMPENGASNAGSIRGCRSGAQPGGSVAVGEDMVRVVAAAGGASVAQVRRLEWVWERCRGDGRGRAGSHCGARPRPQDALDREARCRKQKRRWSESSA